MLRIETFSAGSRRVTSLPGWALGLAAVAAVAIGLVVLAVGAGLALLLAPVVIAAGALARWRIRKALREAGFADPRAGGRRPPDGVIDADYRVIDEQRRP